MSCESKKQQELNNPSLEVETTENEDLVIEKIELNKGKKWIVDAEMMKIIREMESSIQNHTSNTNKNYNALSEDLQLKIEELTSNCTMTGKAHDELHKWLVPYMELVDELYEADEESKQAETFKEIQESFVMFNQYFK
jgi:hypothetical protein